MRLFNKKESDTIEVGWTPLCAKYPAAAAFAPSRFRYKDDRTFTKCPMVQAHIENLYVVRSPIGFSAEVLNEHGDMSIKTDPAQYVDAGVMWIKEGIFQLSMDMGLVTDTEGVIAEIIPLPMCRHEGFTLVPGRFDFYRWPARMLNFAVDWYDTSKKIEFKRGEPLFAIKLSHRSGKPIEFKQCKFTPDIQAIMQATDVLSKGFKGTTQMMRDFKRPKKLLEWLV